MSIEVISSHDDKLTVQFADGVKGKLVRYEPKNLDLMRANIAVIDNSESINQVLGAIRAGAVGIVSLRGTAYGHGVIAAKELGVPWTNSSEKDLGPFWNHGVVMLDQAGQLHQYKSVKVLETTLEFPPTKTLVSMNLGFPEVLSRFPELVRFVDVIGFVRLEFILLDIIKGVHPLTYIGKWGKNELVNRLADKLRVLVKTGVPVLIRTDDFSPNLLFSLEGGSEYEAGKEANSMLGWRGIRRSIDQPEMVRFQFEAIKTLLNEGHDNMGIFPPMTRMVGEYDRWTEIASEVGLDHTQLKFGLMVETPAVAYTLDQFAGKIDFVVIGSNDLTQGVLMIDRNNNHLARLFDVRQEAVKRTIGQIIKICQNQSIPCIIGGQAASDPEIMLELMELGPILPSVSPNLTTISKMRLALAEKGY